MWGCGATFTAAHVEIKCNAQRVKGKASRKSLITRAGIDETLSG